MHVRVLGCGARLAVTWPAPFIRQVRIVQRLSVPFGCRGQHESAPGPERAERGALSFRYQMRRGPEVLDVGGPEGLYAYRRSIKLELVGLVFAAGPRRALFTEGRRGVECEAARGRL